MALPSSCRLCDSAVHLLELPLDSSSTLHHPAGSYRQGHPTCAAALASCRSPACGPDVQDDPGTFASAASRQEVPQRRRGSGHRVSGVMSTRRRSNGPGAPEVSRTEERHSRERLIFEPVSINGRPRLDPHLRGSSTQLVMGSGVRGSHQTRGVLGEGRAQARPG